MIPDDDDAPDRIQVAADELLRHDISEGSHHTCLCGESVWTSGNTSGNTSMARHRATEMIRALDELDEKLGVVRFMP